MQESRKVRIQGFELEFKKVNAISIIDGRVALDLNNELFKQGYEYIDMDNIGLPDNFPKEWLEYRLRNANEKIF